MKEHGGPYGVPPLTIRKKETRNKGIVTEQVVSNFILRETKERAKYTPTRETRMARDPILSAPSRRVSINSRSLVRDNFVRSFSSRLAV